MLELVVPNQRVYDSRNVGQLGPNEIRTINLGPAAVNAIAAHINLTITAPVAAGHAVMFGTAQPPPTSNINFVAAETISNAGVVQVTGGAINVRASVACHVILDVQAVYKP